ncbi:MAG: hypothetical protein FJX34_02450 [Alphaproteobacteria bacterium]|nr:hypothetical protein [Alphaproteobacteria bacterium]
MQRLLPVGFYDLLFDEAQKSYDNINKILAGFLAADYRLIKTPLVEFEENFLETEIKDSFRLTDVISGKNLILRNDITPQISRLLVTRLSQEELPLRICYAGDVLCAKNSELYADRQQTQVGLEIIGCDKQESNFEVIELSLSSLERLGVKDLLIEFSFPDFLEKFLEKFGLTDSSELRSAILKKNISEIRKLLGSNSGKLVQALLHNDSLEFLSGVELDLAQKISEFLRKKFPQLKLGFDLFGDHESGYHNEISFDIFSKNFPYPITRGGRYKLNNFDAVGATIYLNYLQRI